MSGKLPKSGLISTKSGKRNIRKIILLYLRWLVENHKQNIFNKRQVEVLSGKKLPDIFWLEFLSRSDWSVLEEEVILL